MGTIATGTIIAQLAGLASVPIWLLLLGLVVLLVGAALPFVPLFLSLNIAKSIVSLVSDIYQSLKQILYPPKWDSWQVLIWISVFSWVMSMLPESRFLQSLIASSGWLFLIPGVHWFLHQEKLKPATGPDINIKKGLTFNNIFIGPWITGALVCIFLFGSLGEGLTRPGFVCWPPISAVIAALPKFIQMGPTYKIPDKPGDRQNLVLLMLTNLVLSCWLQLYFSTQNWIAQYPSLLASDLSKSAFVVRLNTTEPALPKGALILQQTCDIIQTELQGQSWSRIERWLLELDQQLESIAADVLDSQVPMIEEYALWQLQGKVVPSTEYALKLFALWDGPTVDGNGFHLSETVYFRRVPGARVAVTPSPGNAKSKAAASPGLAKVSCGGVQGPESGRPDLSRLTVDTEDEKRSW